MLILLASEIKIKGSKSCPLGQTILLLFYPYIVLTKVLKMSLTSFRSSLMCF